MVTVEIVGVDVDFLKLDTSEVLRMVDVEESV